jgi:DNA mismatch endonuclease (patch repair protein)
VDGCFWHACPDHATTPRTNTDYWSGKIENNARRDRETDERLAEAGWTVLRFWEHEDVAEVAAAVEAQVRPSVRGSQP